MTFDFTHTTLGQRVVFGTGQAAAAVAAEVERLGAERVMVIVSGSAADKVTDFTDHFPVALWHREVVMHVPAEVADRAVAAAEVGDIDLVVSVGGGSATGLAKAVALQTRIPVIAVPTTFSGSEATNVWGRTENGRKRTGVDDAVLPRTVIYDADLLRDLPHDLAVASGLNALAHCIDSLWAPAADPINRALALEGIRALREGLPQLGAESSALTGLESTLYGAYLAAVAFASAGSGMHHKIAHVLGGTFDLPHAQTHAIVLPYVLAFNAPAVPEAEARMAEAFGAETAVAGLQRLREAVGAPRALSELGFASGDIAEAVDLALEAIPDDNPQPVTRENLTALLTAAWRGDDPQTVAPQGSAGGTGIAAEAAGDGAGLTPAEVEEKLIDTVIASFSGTPDDRLRQLMTAVVTHLHGLIRDVRLTEDEWNRAIGFLTDVGHITDDRRQEFILLSDVLGASMQTINVSNQPYRDATEATVFGPFFVDDAPLIPAGGDIAGGGVGEPCWVEGVVRDTAGAPVPGARIEVWEADEDGLYDVQHDDDRVYGRAHLFSDDDGSFRFWGLTPTPYPIPDDGPVGRLLAATGRSPMRASHLHFMVTAPGLRTLVTHIFVSGDELLTSDSVFGVKDSLIKDFARQPAGTPTPDGRDLGDVPWSRTRFDIVLAPAGV